ncbi:MAG: alpha/beta hydrolase, partial [Marinilabiliales bacterium]
FYKKAMLAFIPHRYFMKRSLYWACENMVQTKEGREIADWFLEANILAIKCFKTKLPAYLSVMSNEEIQSITVPVLYLDGEDNKGLSPTTAVERLHRLAPDIKTEVIPNAGHGLVFTHSETVSEKILDFLNN